MTKEERIKRTISEIKTVKHLPVIKPFDQYPLIGIVYSRSANGNRSLINLQLKCGINTLKDLRATDDKKLFEAGLGLDFWKKLNAYLSLWTGVL